MIAAFALLFAGCTGSQPGTPGGNTSVPPAPPTTPGGSDTPPSPPSATPPVAGNAAITAAQLASHSQESDCWVGYQGKVYDITGYIPKHKNYQMLIVPLCGTAGDFETRFVGKHGLSKVNILEAQPLMGTFAG